VSDQRGFFCARRGGKHRNGNGADCRSAVGGGNQGDRLATAPCMRALCCGGRIAAFVAIRTVWQGICTECFHRHNKHFSINGVNIMATRAGVELTDPIKVLLAIFLPPVGVFFEVGLGLHFWLNIVLTLFGFIPGILHAVYVIFTR
jgi:uncharacterized membrane protein YqaE (UPF0057 family)